MASLRKANAYSKKKVVPYTRVSKKKSKSYVKTVPHQKIVKFTMGNSGMFNDGKFPIHLKPLFLLSYKILFLLRICLSLK